MAASTSLLSAIALSVLCLSSHARPCRGFQTAARPRASAASAAPPAPAAPRAARTARPLAGDDDDAGAGTRLEEPPPPASPSADAGVKLFELEDAFADDGANVVGTKFFGGGAQKDELYVAADEERAVELQISALAATEYRRFEDATAFGDAVARRTGAALQAAVNRLLYDDDEGQASPTAWTEGPALRWDTPFPRSKGAGSPLAALAAAKGFYNKLDVAILAARTVESKGDRHVIEARWDIGAVWPNMWEARVLLTGTSRLTVREGADEGLVLLEQRDRLDGRDGNDLVGRLAAQLTPRFWDVYHIGFSPSSQLDPRLGAPPASADPGGALAHPNVARQKGLLSGYALSRLPPRLVTRPSLVDANGRGGRAAQGLPNHGFTTAIKTMGRKKEAFVPVSPIEVGIAKVAAEDGGGQRVTWSVPVPPEVASRAVLPLPAPEEEDAEDAEDAPGAGTDGPEGLGAVAGPPLTVATDAPATFAPPVGRSARPPPAPPTDLACGYALRPARLVATLPYGGSPQDAEVTDLRRRLYQEAVERDGFVPKLDPATGRPVFFFWMNDAKACFTRAGGLGMAVYEWRAKASRSNEVGLELEC